MNFINNVIKFNFNIRTLVNLVQKQKSTNEERIN